MADTKFRKHPEGPSCKKCGSTNIKDTYTSRFDGREIRESKVLECAIYAMTDLLHETADEQLGANAPLTQLRARTLADLVAMRIVRQDEDSEAGDEEQAGAR
jgi:hypothetical protein